MSFLINFFTVVVVLNSLFIVGIILVQRTKSGGGMGAMAGGTSEAVFGAGAGTVLTKLTTWLIVIQVVSIVIIGYASKYQSESSAVSEKKESVIEAPAETEPAADTAEKSE